VVAVSCKIKRLVAETAERVGALLVD